MSRLFAVILPFALSLNVWAQESLEVVEGEVPAVAAMLPGKMYYSYRTELFSGWEKGLERKMLNLYPGFRDQTPKGGGELTMVIAKTAVVINRPAGEVNLSKLRQIQELQKMQADLVNLAPLNAADAKSNTTDYLAYKNPTSGPGWCAAPESLCITSTFIFSEDLEYVVAGVMMVAGKDDSEIISQSQLQVQEGAGLVGANDWAALTGVSTIPTSVVIQDMFWFSHAVEFGKVVGVIQAHPTDPSKSILTGYTVFAIEKKWWDFGMGGYSAGDFLQGKWMNSGKGLAMGLPKVTQKLFQDLIRDL